MPNTENCFITFNQPVSVKDLPQRFTFPFYYQPHAIALLAVDHLKHEFSHNVEWQNRFSLNDQGESTAGKMFGILVVKKNDGELGFLAAFSGKMEGIETNITFVPPVCDRFSQDDYFIDQQKLINGINTQIAKLEKSLLIDQLNTKLKQLTTISEQQIAAQRETMIERRKIRKQRRLESKELANEAEIARLNDQLARESIDDKNALKQLKFENEQLIAPIEQQLNQLLAEIEQLKHERKILSSALQQQLFSHYKFLNTRGEVQCLTELFKHTAQKIPPAGAGDCAAPKLLQYAFKNQMTPIAMAEFWWGASPKSEIRQHLNFYPACLGKCQPILTHMLSGIEMDKNPLLANPAQGKDIEVIYCDEAIAIINKPAEFLSVPGKTITDCVFARMKKQFPLAEGPLIVHRLDMSTSGLMVVALTKRAHKSLQKQFISRTIKKQYVALIQGQLTEQEGIIQLPLRGDINDRPRQLVCIETGKHAETKWQVIECSKDKNDPWTKVALFPRTGRTHQLRVHCAHPLGLNNPIIGDDLYGRQAQRLYLHAESLSLTHPINKKEMHFQCPAEF